MYKNAWQELSAISLVDGKVTVVVKAEALEDGKYNIYIYKADDLDAKGAIKAGATPLVTQINVDVGLTKKEQTKLAMYANIYPGQHFVADFNFTDTNGQAIAFEEDVIEY